LSVSISASYCFLFHSLLRRFLQGGLDAAFRDRITPGVAGVSPSLSRADPRLLQSFKSSRSSDQFGRLVCIAQHGGQFTAFGLAQFDLITYIHPDLLVGGPDESKNESKIRRRSQPQRSQLHRKARPVAFIYTYSHMFRRPPAETTCSATFKSVRPRFTRS
jgi:hypothetical protein